MNAILLLALAYVPGDAGSLVIENPAVNLGTVRGGPAFSHTFTLFNRSGGIITLAQVQPSCGCLQPAIGSRAIRPGSSTTLTMHVATIAQPEGDNSFTVRVKYHIEGEDSYRDTAVQVRAKLVREVGIEPSIVRLSGKPGLATTIVLTDRRERPLEVQAIQPSSNKVGVRVDNWEKGANGWACRIHVRIAADCPTGTHEEALQIVGKDAEYREIRVPLTVVRRDKQRFIATPAEPVVTERGVSFLLRDGEGQPVEIAGVDADDPALTCRFAEGLAATAKIDVLPAANKTPQTWSAIRVHVKSPVEQTVVVPVGYQKGR